MATNPLTTLTKWTDRLALDIALYTEGSGEELHEVLDRHKLTTRDLLDIKKDTQFNKRVETFQKEVRDKGVTFKLKARAQAEELLTTSWELIHDRDVSPAVKADLIKSTVRWAGLETKEELPGASAGGVTILIDLGDKTTPIKINNTQTIEHEITTLVEQEDKEFEVRRSNPAPEDPAERYDDVRYD